MTIKFKNGSSIETVDGPVNIRGKRSEIITFIRDVIFECNQCGWKESVSLLGDSRFIFTEIVNGAGRCCPECGKFSLEWFWDEGEENDYE